MTKKLKSKAEAGQSQFEIRTGEVEVVINPDDKKYFNIDFYNFKGLERFTRNTKIPGIARYDAGSGMKGLHKWTRATLSCGRA